jgi:hypothetical protein
MFEAGFEGFDAFAGETDVGLEELEGTGEAETFFGEGG